MGPAESIRHFLATILRGVVDILREKQGLADDDCYHAFCRLLARIKNNFQLVELVRSLSTWAGRIVFVNGHGGHVATLSSVVPQMMGEGHEVAWAACAVQGMDSHAGHAETSLMLHLAPSRVDITLAVPGNVAALAELLPTLRSEGVAGVSASGVLGDPTGATAEHGSALLVEMIRDVHSRIMAAAVGRDGRLTRPASTLTGSLT